MNVDLSQITPEWLIARRAWTTGRIAEEIGCAPSTVSHLFQRLGVERWRTSSGSLCVPPEWLEARTDMTLMQIADELGCSTRSVNDLLKRYGLTARSHQGRVPHCPCKHEVICRQLQGYGLPVLCEPGALAELAEMGIVTKEVA